MVLICKIAKDIENIEYGIHILLPTRTCVEIRVEATVTDIFESRLGVEGSHDITHSL
jgi:hypothetical protein